LAQKKLNSDDEGLPL